MTTANQRFQFGKLLRKATKCANVDVDKNSSVFKIPNYVKPEWNTYILSGQNGDILCPFSDQNSSKTIPFGAAHTYIANIKENQPPSPQHPHTFFEGGKGKS